jgi:ubiquinone/menaquinone biosynthesis C-methylase UbiE
MVAELALKVGALSPQFKRLLWRRWYQYLAGYKLSDWRFMNYGYASLDPSEEGLVLSPEDEPNRHAVHLYHQVATGSVLAGRKVLEVGCGRGGGAAFVKQYHRPMQMTGVDFSARAVRFCQDHYHAEGLSFMRGDAEALPFGDRSFDAVINVESSHCYGSMPAFLREVRRVLRPGGALLFADLRARHERDLLHRQLVETGMAVREKQDITGNVVEALHRDSERKARLIQRSANKYLIGTFREFAALEGSKVFESFKKGSMVYVRYALQK